MKQAVKIMANVIATLALAYALLQLVNLPAIGNALDAFYGTAAWSWVIDKFNVYGPEDQENLIANCLGIASLLISIIFVIGANRLIFHLNQSKQHVRNVLPSKTTNVTDTRGTE